MGKVTSKTLIREDQYISMISGNISDDGEITGTYRFLSGGDDSFLLINTGNDARQLRFRDRS